MTPSTKTTRHAVGLSLGDDGLLQEAAAVVGESVEEFLVKSCRERAEMVLTDRTQLVLCQDTWAAFCAELDRDAEINPAVVKLLQRPRPE
jgi:uncharacterized protein (DUF1778 family)